VRRDPVRAAARQPVRERGARRAGAYFALERLGVARGAAALLGSSVTIAVRLASIRWQLELPVYRLETPRPRPLFSARATSRLTGEHPVPRVDDGGAG
jgi:hypothetical protein